MPEKNNDLLTRLLGKYRRDLVVEYWQELLTFTILYLFVCFGGFCVEIIFYIFNTYTIYKPDKRVISFFYDLEFYSALSFGFFLICKFVFWLIQQGLTTKEK